MFGLFLVLVGLGTVVWVGVIIRELFRFRYINRLREMEVAERNRNRFGIMRTQLMGYVREGEIDIQSEMFRLLYTSMSVLMRNPHTYNEVSTKVITGLPKVVRSEKRTRRVVSENEAIMCLSFAENLILLIKDYSRLARWVLWVSPMKPRKHVPVAVERIVKKSHSYIEEVEPVREASEQLEHYGNEVLGSEANRGDPVVV